MQFQADILQTNVVRSEITETTALGAAYLAGLAVGYWKNIDELEQKWKLNRQFKPAMVADERDRRIAEWARAIRANIAWADNKQ